MLNYVSDYTKFMNEYLEEHPDVAASRIANRAILWDVKLNPEEQEDFNQSELAKPAYAYQSNK